ncbi:Lrp/AsnC family transcriptional regulator [Leifsonia sp. NPDC080035]|uniref:Lrp/AsnC family transcriptional regulator n=1 Tax=Leifsonia sp. NPDC080035 TaxID=3143936 RepID=A0AAU7GAC2_9MICO
MELDETHLKMLELLREDGRISIAALAEQLGISRSNAYARYEALVSDGVIRGIHADIDPQAVGLSVAALVFVTLRQSQWADFRARVETLPELEYFTVMTGEHDAMLLVRASGVSAIHNLVATRLAQWPSIKATVTVFLMDEYSAQVSLRLPEPVSDTLQASGERMGMTRFVRTSDQRAERLHAERKRR